jgi:hypothetical protein
VRCPVNGQKYDVDGRYLSHPSRASDSHADAAYNPAH